ncbi:MAG: bifunctional nuclease family protein [Actinomycetota bacterium]
MRALSVRRVERSRATNSFVVTLREDDQPRRQFDIFIGLNEGMVIRMMLDGEVSPRPLTHDLFVLALERIGVSVKRTVLTHVKESTYFAELVLLSEAGEETTVSCRPSDGLALALRANAPIFAAESLLEEVGSVPQETPDEEGEILDEFRDFIENINPDDFNL